MTPARFLETRRPAWDRLEALVRKGRFGVRRLSEEELYEMTRLYPAVSVDAARARMYRLDERTQGRINTLAIATHGLLYRRKHVDPLKGLWQFYACDFPRLFRRLWPYVTLAVILFAVGALGAYVTVRLRPATAYVLVPQGLEMRGGDSGEVRQEDISERFRRMPQPPMATGIMANNIGVALIAFALGITAGIGTCYVIFTNAVMVGAFVGHFVNHGLGFVCWSFLAGHGILEIFAILVAGGAGLRLGLTMAMPGALTRLAAMRQGGREAALLVLGTIPMFIVAGTIEGFVTPSHLAGGAKIALGLVVWGTAMAWLLLAGRKWA
jgi:uncharacterized membrane protein SpoIIM required for sporulation